MTIANQLWLAREDAGLSRPKLAAKLGVSAQTVWRIETGRTGVKYALAEEWFRVCDAAPSDAPVCADDSVALPDAELAIMQALTGLDDAARRRVLAWTEARWGRA